jgi:hypothetical protein
MSPDTCAGVRQLTRGMTLAQVQTLAKSLSKAQAAIAAAALEIGAPDKAITSPPPPASIPAPPSAWAAVFLSGMCIVAHAQEDSYKQGELSWKQVPPPPASMWQKPTRAESPKGYLPPVEYDHPYAGELITMVVDSKKQAATTQDERLRKVLMNTARLWMQTALEMERSWALAIYEQPAHEKNVGHPT